MKNLSLSPPRARAGFGLLEVILVFVLVIAAAAVTFVMFESARPSADVNTATANLSSLTSNIKGAYGIGHSYQGLSATGLIQNKLVPTAMVNGTSLQNFWSGGVLVNDSGASDRYQHFIITYEGVPANACLKFALGAAPYFSDVSVATSTSGPFTVVRQANGTISTSGAVSGCSGNGPFVIEFMTK